MSAHPNFSYFRQALGKALRPNAIKKPKRNVFCRLILEQLEDRTVPSLTVGPNVNIGQLAGNQAESTISINPNNVQNLFASDTWSGMCRYSTNGGTSWTNSNMSALPATIGDVQTAWDSYGNLFITRFGSGLDVVVAVSTDGGASFGGVQTIASSTSSDQPSITAGANSVWVSFTNSSNQLAACGASVTGLGVVGSFGSPETAPGGSSGDFGDIAIGPSGQVLVVYQNNGSGEGPDTIHANLDADGLGAGGFAAQTAPTSTNVGGFDHIPPQPSRSIDAEANLAWDRSGGAHNGRVYLVYADETPNESNNTDIYVRYSDNNGASWSSAVKVNDDATVNSQFQPAIALDQTTGNVAVTWYDARNAGAPDVTVQVFGAVSTDGGATFSANVQISTGTTNATVAAAGSFNLGDYDKMAFVGGVFYRSWADNSNSTGNNPNGALNALNIYTAKVTYSVGVWVVTDPNGLAGSGNAGDVTLPYAVTHAQDGDSIYFANTLKGDTITLNATLTINHGYAIYGPGAANLTISGGGAVQDFFVNPGVASTISSLTIANGKDNNGGGGGILNRGTLTVDGCMISGNDGTVSGTYNPYGSGGGILNTGTLTLTNSTVAHNIANYGSSLENYNYSGTANTFINNCTFFGNTGSSGGGVNNYAGGTLSLSNSTVAYNFGYGTYVSAMDNCIVAGNTSGAIYNGTSGSFTSTVATGLANALAYNGGPTQTLALLPGSVAHAVGDPAQAGTISQNGRVRPAAPDVGAVQGTLWIVVDPNGNAGSGNATYPTLPFAVANAQNTDQITFASSLSGFTITLNATLTISHNYTITGLGAANLAVSGNNLVQDFFVNTGVAAGISSLTIKNGTESNGGGGGILNRGVLNVDGCLISGNNGTATGAYNPYGSGGGILNTGTLTLTNSTVANNVANYGGGLENYGGSATTTINDCTFLGNTANFGSAAGVNNYAGGSLSLSNSTVAFNNGYGTYVSSMDNCIVAGNTSGPFYSGTGGSFTITSATGLATSLAYNGGPTPTLALLAGSAAHGAGDPGQAGTTAQNGTTRPAAPDVGAVQGALWIVTDPNGALGSGGPGDVTLPYAVANAQDTDQIIFANSLKGDTIALNGTLTISHSYTISGLGAANLAVSGGGAVRDFLVNGGVSASISGLTIENGGIGGYGGGVYNAGTLVLNADRITGNHASTSGGGIFNGGTLTMSDSTLNGNDAFYGGGIENTNVGSLAIANIRDCTFFGNSTVGSGSGVNNWAGDSMSLTNCTVAYNTGGSAGVYNPTGGEVALDNCIVAGNTAADTFLTIGAFNLTGVTANMANTLADNGGATQTLALLPGSAAHATGDPGQAGVISQNGVIRPAVLDIGACQGTTWIVTDPNGNAGSGSAGDVTLPYAVANAQNTDRITFANSLSGDTITLNGTLTISHSYTITGLGAANLAVSGQNTVQDFHVNQGVTSSISGLTVEQGQSQFGGGIANAGVLTLTDDAVSNNGAVNNNTITYGAGIDNAGILIASDSTINGNTAWTDGGGIANRGIGAMSLTNCTVANNAGYTYGGGIYNTSTLQLTDCTISGNTPYGGFSDNNGGGIFIAAGSTVTMDNTIVAGNTGTTGTDVDGTIATANYCLIGNTSGNTITTGANNQLNVAANLAPLAYNGGPTQTMALLAGSAARATGDPGQVGTTSQNGVLRSATPDIGAFQARPSVTASAANLPDSSTTLTINGSFFDAIPGHNTVAFNLGVTGSVTAATNTQLTVTINTPPTALGSLTAVVTTDGVASGAPVQVATEINANWHVTDSNGSVGGGSLTDMTLPYAVAHALDGDTIDFAAPLSGSTINLNGTLIVSHSYTITGLGAANLAVSGNNTTFADFQVNLGVTATISSLTIENGQSNYGGGISNAGNLTLTNDAVSNNGAVANQTIVYGAGIYNTGTMNISYCTINGNTAWTDGGGIYNSGTMSLSNSTIANNAAYTEGGGILSAAGTLSLTDCTISGNTRYGGFSANNGGGIFIAAGSTVTMDNTIVAGNTGTTGTDVNGTIGSANYCLIGNTGGMAIGAGANNHLNVSANLGGLANNGGPTQTMALLAGSAALNTGDPGQAGTTAQNGVVRPAVPDIGAFQSVGLAPAVLSITANGGAPQYTDTQGLHWSLAGQNSVVEQVLVHFNEPVTLDPGAFSVTNHAVSVLSGASPNTLAITTNAPVPVGGGPAAQDWIVTFAGPGTFAIHDGLNFGVGNVVRDGVYNLVTDGTKVHANAQTAAASSNVFWAMYGAVHDNILSPTLGDGNSEVFLDTNDFNDFANIFNNGYDSSQAQYGPLVGMDYDLDGFVDADTFNAFATAFNSSKDWAF